MPTSRCRRPSPGRSSAPGKSNCSNAGSTKGPSTSRIGRSFRRERPPVTEDMQVRRRRRQPDRPLHPAPAGEARGSNRAAEADKTTLLRRVTFDLTGLPPTPEEVDDFLADTFAAGLRAGRRSAARLAALWRADGHRTGSTRPATPTPTATRATSSAQMWRWRDWVIEAFNRNHAVR